MARERGALAVDAHLADQSLVALALGGGSIAAPRTTDHVATGLPVFETFGYDLSVDESGAVPVLTG